MPDTPQNKKGRGLDASTRRRTKIVCTLGPASSDVATIEAMIAAGMNVARINCSHGTHETQGQAIANVRSVAKRLGVFIPVILDLQGPKMRIGEFEFGEVTLNVGDSFTLTTRDVAGDWRGVTLNYPPLIRDVDIGDRILLGDGEIELRVTEKGAADVVTEIVVGGVLKSHKGVNAPGVKLKEKVPTPKDIADVEFGIANGVDWMALSFVRTAADIAALRAELDKRGSDIPIITKIEKQEALDDIDAIMDATDAIMIARGDLGLDLPIHRVPMVQKDLTRACLAARKPCITATQMLESMIGNPRPTRAEAADVANAVFDHTDAVMLSGETAAGKYPVESVKMMSEIALAAEERIDYGARLAREALSTGISIPHAIAHAAATTALEINARAVISCTRSGQTALHVSTLRPPAKIAVVSPDANTLNRTMLYWNTHPVQIDLAPETDEMIAAAKEAVRNAGIARAGDNVVVIAGIPVDEPGTTNMIKADTL